MSQLPAVCAGVTVSGNAALTPGGQPFAHRRGPGFQTMGLTRVQDYLRHIAVPGVSPSRLRIVDAVALNEGRFEAINSYDNCFLSFGILQWTAGHGHEGGELAGLIERLKREEPTAFQMLLGVHGVDVVPIKHFHTGYLSVAGKALRSTADKEPLRTALWAYRFWQAGQDDAVRACQIRHALSRVDDFMQKPLTGGRPVSAYLTSEYGVALVLDEHVNRPGHVQRTLNDALSALLATGVPHDPTTWTTDNEATLLTLYVEMRNKSGMTDPAARSNRISGCQLSRERGSFKS